MFKKLMSFLFEEEEIIEEVSEKPSPRKEVVPTFQPEEIHDEPKEEVVDTRVKSIFVDSDEAKPLAPVHESPLKPSQNKIEQKREKIEPKNPSDYVFSSSISPIFGKLPEKEREPVLIQPKIDLDQEKSILGTIISPIYGIKKRQKNVIKNDKPNVVNTAMSLEDILGVNDEVGETPQQLNFDDQVNDEQISDDQNVHETPVVEKPKEEILMQLFEEENDS